MTIRRARITEGFIKTATGLPTGRKYPAKDVPLPSNGQSKSQDFMARRETGGLSAAASGALSEERYGEVLKRGTQAVSEESGNPSPLLVYSNSYKHNQAMKEAYGMEKTAVSIGMGAGAGGNSTFNVNGGNTVRQAPEVYSPLFQIANLQLPRERITMNAWNRSFVDTNPIVHNCINLHATYPLGKMSIRCEDKKVGDFFTKMAEEIDLVGVLQDMALEFYKIGEVFPYAELDPDRGVWKNIVVQNPDYIEVKTSVLSGETVISMRPDAALKKLVMSNNPADIKLRDEIDEEILYHVRRGEDIPLDNFHISHLKMLSSPYDSRGTSMIVSIYKDLMLYDKLRESKFAQADNLVNPITLVTVGGSAEGEYHPTESDLEGWRQTLEAAQYDKDFKIISHAGVKIERVGASGSIIDISGDMNFIVDNILYGLMTPKAIITQEGSSYNSASIGLEVLKQRYDAFRNMISTWLYRKIFAPISEINDFYSYVDGEKELIVPTVEWNQMILFDMDNYINTLTQLSTPGPGGETPKVSNETLFKSLGLDHKEERRKVRDQMIQDLIAMKEKQVASEFSLSQLRSLKTGAEIVEKTGDPLPGVPGADAQQMNQGAGVLGGPMGTPPMGAPGGGIGGPLGDLGGPGLGGDMPGGGLGDLGGPPGDIGGGMPPIPTGGEGGI